MKLLNKIFSQENHKILGENFKVTVTEKFVKIDNPHFKTEQIFFDEITEIKLIYTDKGPLLEDIWLELKGIDNKCTIPHGADGFEKLFDTISKFDGFNFENFVKSMACTDNAEFFLWSE